MPPSSIDVRSTWGAAWASRMRPTSVEPVNESLRRRESAISGPQTREADDEVSTLTTPAGAPASSRMAASAFIERGVYCAAFTIVVQPAARAGAILRAPIANGKFHGVTSRHGPTGRLTVRMRPAPLGAGE